MPVIDATYKQTKEIFPRIDDYRLKESINNYLYDERDQFTHQKKEGTAFIQKNEGDTNEEKRKKTVERIHRALQIPGNQ